MKSKSGFTIVELTVTISVIAILASIAFVSYSVIQRDARDNTRRGNVRVITEALEKYYDKNGEYPSVRNLVNNFGDNDGADIGSFLNIDPSVLKTPQLLPVTETNALREGTTYANDYILYSGINAVDQVKCDNGPPGGCDEFTISYKEESGTIVTVQGRHKGHPTN